MKTRLQFSQSQPRVDGISNTVHPLGAWQPSDSIWMVSISRIAGASSSSGSDARGPAAPAAPVPASDEACPGASHAGCAVRDPSGQEEIRSYSDVESTHKRFRQDSNPQEPNMAHCRGTGEEQVWRCGGGAPASQDFLRELVAGTLSIPVALGELVAGAPAFVHHGFFIWVQSSDRRRMT